MESGGRPIQRKEPLCPTGRLGCSAFAVRLQRQSTKGDSLEADRCSACALATVGRFCVGQLARGIRAVRRRARPLAARHFIAPGQCL